MRQFDQLCSAIWMRAELPDTVTAGMGISCVWKGEAVMKEHQTSVHICRISWCVILLGLMLYWLSRKAGADPARLLSIMPPCLLRTWLGIYCPGCGGTHAVLALLEGHPLRSLAWHPIVMYAVLLYGWYLVTNTVQWLSGGRIPVGSSYHRWYGYGAAAVVLVNWIVRNVLLLVFHITLP